MSKNYKLYLFSIIISLLVSFLITSFVYFIVNKDKEVLKSYNQDFVLNDNIFSNEMSSRIKIFLKKFEIDLHMFNNNRILILLNQTANLGLDEIINYETIEEKSTNIFYYLFKEDYFINKFNKAPQLYLNEFKKDYLREYKSDEKMFDIFESKKIEIISLDNKFEFNNFNFKNFISKQISLRFYLETHDSENMEKVFLENRIITLYFERYLINEFYNQFRDYFIVYINKKIENMESIINLYQNSTLAVDNKSYAFIKENIKKELEYSLSKLNQFQSEITNELKKNNILIKENFYPISFSKVSIPSVLYLSNGFTIVSYIILFILNTVIIFFISLIFYKKLNDN